MTGYQWLGVLIVASLLGAAFAWVVWRDGLREALVVCGFILSSMAVALVLVLGVALIAGDVP